MPRKPLFGIRLSALTPTQPTTELEAIASQFADVPGGLMPALHAVQHHSSYISKEMIPVLAKLFNITVAEV